MNNLAQTVYQAEDISCAKIRIYPRLLEIYLRLSHDEAIVVSALGVLVLLVVLRPEAVAQLVDEGEVGLFH